MSTDNLDLIKASDYTLEQWKDLWIEERRSRDYWEKRHNDHEAGEIYYRDELTKAHTLLGRVTHQLSERWDTVNLTEHFPTSNLNRARSVSNPTGEKE